MYSTNDWRDYLQHNWGTSAKMKEAEKKYNAEYYQKHRDEILAERKKEARRNSYENEEGENGGWDYTKKDGASRSWDKDYANDEEKKKELMRLANEDAFTDTLTEHDVLNEAEDNLKKSKDYSPEVLENVRKNNQAVRDNITNLMKTVQDYVKKNGDKLSSDQIAKLYKDMDHQVSLEEKRVIDVGSKEGKAYINSLGSGKSSKSKSKSTKKSKSSRSSKKKNSSTTITQNTNTNSSKDTEKKTSVIDDMRKKYGR